MLTHLPAQNVKSLPALSMLRGIPEAQDRTIVEASSGSTVLSLGIIARVLWGHNDVNAYVTNKKNPESLNLLRFFGITPHLYGGLAQQEPTDESGIMCRLRRLTAKRKDVTYPGQYDNDNNWRAHEQWTGPQILRQLPEINLFCTTVGTGGCITGTSAYLKSQKPSIRTLGVFNVFGDPTPGPRHFQGFNSCGFPWEQLIDDFAEVASVDSYRMSMHLSREGLIAGPSSGQALRGLLDYIGKIKESEGLASLSDGATGEVSCVFTCSDLPYQYLAGYYQKLGAEEFPPIQNKARLHPHHRHISYVSS
ncbi:putative siderophore biosynthesis protein SbnA [Madurella mycetomatis]|uniref:Putative siderophore biosynthesis protein SbnA n=1 Tax=Madurella mycetomatis TaxID=100816 RepID=A0A175WBN6_9PEZI|nr:putative siderophore biosynthesis protein SbnA [Madurella mycetomatis]KXX81043.1 putative siderophore biosynthesis protein SbnA [Madurella mycetomatis]